MVITTKHTKVKNRDGTSEPARLLIPRYATAPAKLKDGEIWFDVTANTLKVRNAGSTYTIGP